MSYLSKGKQHLSKVAAVVGVSAIASIPAHAAVDASVTAAIDTAATDIGTIGAAMLGLAVVAMTYKWLRASFF